MKPNNKQIDHYLRRELMRRILMISVVTVIFVGFMSYALYKFYGPDAQIVDYFPEVNQGITQDSEAAKDSE